MKFKLRLIVCAILVVVSVNANATMAPVSKVKQTPNFNSDILLLIYDLETLAPHQITDCLLKLSALSLDLNIYLDTAMLPAEIYDLIVNKTDDLRYSDSFKTSLQVAPEQANLVISRLHNPLK